ncbi:MAG: phage terminase large subunit [Corynebacterium sp.]|nr:phage terminase large subunit [Corynebacterium sp.]
MNLWYGSVRSSKTYAQIHDFVARMTMTTGEGTNLLVGHSTNTVWRNIFQPIVSRPEFAAIAPHLNYRQNAPSGTLFGKPFSVVGANNEASWLAIQGLTVENCWGDEAVAWPESFWDMLYSRLSLGRSRVLVTCNPGTANHYLKRRVVDMDGIDPDVHVEKFLLGENPSLPRKVVDRLERQYTGLFYRRMILAQWVAAEGAVYQLWDPDTMIQPIADGVTLLATGIDYGVTNPSAGVALGITPDGTLQVVSEWNPNPAREQRMTDVQLADSYLTWEGELAARYGAPPIRRYADPSAASFIEEMRQRRVPFYKADNEVVEGINTCSSLLDTGRMFITPDTPALQTELSEYRWDAKATEKGLDKPLKVNDHHADAFRYAVHSSRLLWRNRLRPATLTATPALTP